MDDDSGKARRNLIAVSTVVIVIVFLGVESLSFAGLTVRFGFDSWRVWLVSYLFVVYFIFRYCLNPTFQESRRVNTEAFETEIDQVAILFLIKMKDSSLSCLFFKKIPVSDISGDKSFLHNGHKHEYFKVGREPGEDPRAYVLYRSFLKGGGNAVSYNIPVRVYWPTRVFLKLYCFVLYGNGLWSFLDTMLPFWLGLLALALSSFKFFSIIL